MMEKIIINDKWLPARQQIFSRVWDTYRYYLELWVPFPLPSTTTQALIRILHRKGHCVTTFRGVMSWTSKFAHGYLPVLFRTSWTIILRAALALSCPDFLSIPFRALTIVWIISLIWLSIYWMEFFLVTWDGMLNKCVIMKGIWKLPVLEVGKPASGAAL